MSRFFIQLSDELPCIENIRNEHKSSVVDDTLEKVLNNFDLHSIIFVVNDETYESFKNYYTIGYYDKCDIVLVNDLNIDSYQDAKLKNVYLFVNDESKLLSNFKKIYENVEGFIEFKMMDFSSYDENILDDQISSICDILFQLEQIESPLIVKQLNGYKMTPKFQEFGDGDYFIGTDNNVYCHPNFYYNNDNLGVICSIDNFKERETNTHFTKPHLICVNCESFYCDRNIYNNKTRTGEFKVPCSNSCMMTSFFSKHSKLLLNRIVGEEAFDPHEHLDKVVSFKPTIEYDRFINNEIKTNNFKELNFDDRRLW